MKLIKKYAHVFLIIGLIVLDQLLKLIVPKDLMLIEGFLKITYTENTGGAFGVLSGESLMLIISNIVILIAIVRFMIIQKEMMTNVTKVGAVCLLSGGISNLIDRIFRGFVIDYIDINQLISFPVFNLADVVLVIGWVCFAIGIIVVFRK